MFSSEASGQNANSICWSEDVKLTWSDFQGKPDTSGVFVNMKAATSYQLKKLFYLDGGLPNYQIANVFHKQSSWTRDTSKLLLSHEQLHFDISELYARKIRKGISELRMKGTIEKEKYLELIKENFEELDVYQDKYDKGTRHGAIDILQEEWNVKVKKELDLLKKYATRAEDCKSKGTP